MFKLERKYVINAEVECGGEIIPLKINLAEKAQELWGKQKEIAEIQKRKATPMEQVDLAYDMLTIIFSKESMEKLLAFYDGSKLELVDGIAPFVNEEIMPRVNQMMRQKAKELKKYRR